MKENSVFFFIYLFIFCLVWFYFYQQTEMKTTKANKLNRVLFSGVFLLYSENYQSRILFTVSFPFTISRTMNSWRFLPASRHLNEISMIIYLLFDQR